ncbi:glycosyltransferase [Botrimarina sp.]|uniref:glycosyltransferase family 2 protein n=1 Tax=Botrimarina sp. TaxID=2795802 RepID=UPI0032F01B9B
MTTADGPHAADEPIDVTIVVGSYNRADMLAETLASLTALSTESASGERFVYEVVVVDNASTDHTQQVIEHYSRPENRGAAARLRGFYEEQAGVSHARNRGMAEAVGQWIAFHDDDQRAHPDWIVRLLELTGRRGVKVAGGAVHLVLPHDNTRRLAPACRVLLGEKVGWDAEQPYTRKRVPGTNNLIFHRSVIDAVGGFDTRLTNGGEDADLYRRLRGAGYEAWYTPDAIVYHLIPPQRLGDDYMRWTATRHGEHLALRELRDWGRAKLGVMMGVRAAQAALSYFPRWLLFTLTRQRERALGARSLLWRSRGYLSLASRLVLHGESTDPASDSPSDFRAGRERLMRRGAAGAG